MIKYNRYIAIVMTMLLFVVYSTENIYAKESQINKTYESKNITIKYMNDKGVAFGEFDSKNIDKSYKHISDTCVGISINYDDFITLSRDEVKNIIEDGVIFVISVNNNNDVQFIKNVYSEPEEYQMYCDEKIAKVCLYNYNGDVIISYVCVDETDNKYADEKEEFLDEEFPEIVEKISINTHYTYQEKLDDISYDKLEKEIQFQTIDLPTRIKPHTSVKYSFNDDGIHICTQYITMYVHEGCKYGDSAYDYVSTAFEVAPTQYLNISDFLCRIERKNSHTTITDASYIDDNASEVSYTLSATSGLSMSGISGTVNSSVTNSYNTTALDVVEKFANKPSYVDWQVTTKKKLLGQARIVEPCVVIKLDDSKRYLANVKANMVSASVKSYNFLGICVDTQVLESFSTGITYGYK